MHRIILFFLFLGTVNTWAQKTSKLNIDLHLLLENTPASKQGDTYIPILAKGNLATIASIVKQNNSNTYKYGVKNIASLIVSLHTVQQLLASEEVFRLEHKKAIMHELSHPEDSAMLTNNNAFAAHTGAAPLPYGFEGEGVLLGMIDDGIEWKHPDFWQPDSTTRILHIWDQNSTDTAYYEQQFGYGATWDSATINRGRCYHDVGDHGSHVMGIAAGNGFASGKFVGIAPKADIACVKINKGNFLSSFVDGLYYLFLKADANGQACVVNSSVGSYMSGHDSQDLYAQLVDNILTAKEGRSLVQAAGNERGNKFHLGVDLQNSTSISRFRKGNNEYYTKFSIFSDTADFNTIDFSLQLIDPNTSQIKSQTINYNVLQHFAFNGGVAQAQQFFYDANGNPIILDIFIDQYGSSYEVEVRVGSIFYNGDWQLTTTGTGRFDIWSHPTYTGSSQILSSINIPNYTNPDDFQTIVGYWTTSDKVITVGSYQNRDYHIDYAGDTVFLGTGGFPKLGISQFSSLGPTRTGALKPDITAPGGQVLSAFTLNILNSYKQINSDRLNEDGWHATNRGTSMSAPMVAGAVALYLECKPYADWADIKQAVTSSAFVDHHVFTQVLALPNIHWGYGKLDVYELLKSCLIYGCMDSLALNYNPLATVSDSSCGYIINITQNRAPSKHLLRCYPNPSQQYINIKYQLTGTAGGSIKICNSLGQIVWQKKLPQKEGIISWDKGNLAVGNYWVLLSENGHTKQSQQVIFLE